MRIIETDKTLPAAYRAVEIRTTGTDVAVRETEADTIRIHLHGQADRGSCRLKLAVKARGDLLTVDVRRVRRLRVVCYDHTQSALDIYLPRGMVENIGIHTSFGDVEIEALRTTVLLARTISGDLRAARTIAERTLLGTSSGDIAVEGSFGELDCHSVSGDLRLYCREFAHDVKLGSSSGDIHLVLPGNAEFDLAATSSAGKVSCGFPITITKGRGGRRLFGTVGGGHHQVGIRTTTGDVRVIGA